MDLGLKGKVALVTGASKGIGKAAATALAREGCDLAICARHGDALEEAAVEMRRHPVNVLTVEADLTREPDLDRLVGQTIDTFGRVDILVNNAGRVGDGDFMSMDTQAWRDLFELNVFAVVTLTRKIVPYMQRQQWGRIINISSENGEQPDPDMAAYNVTKGALDNLTKTLSMILGPDNILVNTVSPAFIRTPLVEDMLSRQAEQQGVSVEEAEAQFLKNKRPYLTLGRAGTMEETGSVIAFLASEQASFVTGSNYRVDGGSVGAV